MASAHTRDTGRGGELQYSAHGRAGSIDRSAGEGSVRSVPDGPGHLRALPACLRGVAHAGERAESTEVKQGGCVGVWVLSRFTDSSTHPCNNTVLQFSGPCQRKRSMKSRMRLESKVVRRRRCCQAVRMIG